MDFYNKQQTSNFFKQIKKFPQISFSLSIGINQIHTHLPSLTHNKFKKPNKQSLKLPIRKHYPHQIMSSSPRANKYKTIKKKSTFLYYFGSKSITHQFYCFHGAAITSFFCDFILMMCFCCFCCCRFYIFYFSNWRVGA